jgi:hypothetical protein
MPFLIALLVALRVSLARRGFSEFRTVLRREREARKGQPLSAEERLEHRGMAFSLLGFICFLGFLITDGMHAARWVRATLMVSAIMLVLAGWGHYVASGLSEGRKQ